MADPTEEVIPIDKLIVNPGNYRFDPVADQNAALKVMMESLGNDVANLAVDISERGLNPLKQPMVVKGDGGYLVLEGNRRVTAIKLIRNPELIATAYTKKNLFQSLHEKYGRSAPDAIRVTVYQKDDIESANHWVALEHNGKSRGVGTVEWGPKEKSRFAARHKKTLPSKAVQVVDFLSARRVETDGVASTTLDRILQDPDARKLIGIVFGKDGLDEHRIDDEVMERLRKIIRAMQAKSFKVSKVYGKKERLKWVKNLVSDPLIPQNQTLPSKLGLNEGKKAKTDDNGGVPSTITSASLLVPPKAPPAPMLSYEAARRIIQHICGRFHLVVHQINNRYDGRNTLRINDEYDVQDLFHGLLRLYFDDVRKEEPTDSYAGASNRFDFFLKQDEIGLEMKMTRPGLKDSRIGSELLVDIPRYRNKANCKYLFCFVYDPGHHITNAQGLALDIQKESRKNFGVELIINQG